MSYDLNTDIGKVRLMIRDSAGTAFTDDEINAVFSIESVTVRLAGRTTTVRATVRRVAACCFDILAGDPKRMGVHLKALDIDVDFGARAKEYREMAKQLRSVEDDSGAFAITEMVATPSAYRDRLDNEIAREDA